MNFATEKHALMTAVALLDRAQSQAPQASGVVLNATTRALVLAEVLGQIGMVDELVRININSLVDVGGGSPQLTRALELIDARGR